MPAQTRPVEISGITLAGADAGNYILVSDTSGAQADIAKAGLTITATDASKVAGQGIVLSGYSTRGLVAVDSVASVRLTSSGEPASAVAGSYAIVASGSALGNYAVRYEDGTLLVTPATSVPNEPGQPGEPSEPSQPTQPGEPGQPTPSLTAQVQFDDKRLKDDIDLFGSKSDKRARVVIATLNGNSRDNLLGGGVNSFALAWSQGSLNIDGQLNQTIDDLTAGTQGRFHKLNPSLVRLQRLTERFSLYTQLQGQWADGNLDSSEKISLGGAYGVRAYPQGEASGDQGWLANLELRYALTEAWQLSTFVDHGEVRLNKDTWSSGENHRSLSAAGVGGRWAAYGWQVNALAAWKLGNADPQSDVDRSPRVWAQVVKFF